MADDMDDMFPVAVNGFLSDQGSVLVFQGYDEAGERQLTFAADHRPGVTLVEAYYEWVVEGYPEGENPVALISEWQVLSAVPAAVPIGPYPEITPR